ncbi:MAG: hypothetical protein NXI10_05470 [bacterium]|nr:hypothetical protein [bacterium]
MTEGAAYKIGEKMMNERGLCEKDFIVRYRHLVLDINEIRVLEAENQLFILIDYNYAVKIKSKAGVYDQADLGIDEQQHVHRGRISLINTIARRSEIRFLQLIPIQKKNNHE